MPSQSPINGGLVFEAQKVFAGATACEYRWERITGIAGFELGNAYTVKCEFTS